MSGKEGKGFSMKRLIVVLSGLLVLPAFADVAPVSVAETLDETGVAVTDADITRNVIVPVDQPSKTLTRSANSTGRATSRVVPSASGTVASSRGTSSRTTAASRNATAARSGSVVNTVSRGAEPARVSSRPSRNLSATDGMVGVTTRRATTASNAGVAARVGVASPAVTGRISSRAPVGQIRAATVSATIASAPEAVIETTTEEKQDAIAKMDDLTQLSDYCKAQYTSCMDNFCNVLDDNQGRCSCSKNIKNYEKTETALKSATEALQDVAQQIQYIGLTGDEIKTLFTQTEAELQMQATTDNTQIRNDLENIKEMIVGIKTGTATSTETGMNFDLSGLLDFNIDNTGFDLNALFGGNNTNTNSISNQRGEQLYKTAAARCKSAVLNSCQNQGVDVAIITNAYDMEIDKQCIAYERQLIDANDNMVRTVRNAKTVLQKARLMVAQQKNSYDLRGCVNALDSCMQDDFVCGTDYENCLDPTGRYIVNGEVVVGSTPGFWIGTQNESDATSDYDTTPVQHQGGIYATWLYDSGNKHAWYGKDTNIAAYVDASIASEYEDILETNTNLVKYLQHKIGYNKDNRNYGMCIGVLNKCQNYTYEGKEFKVDNAVVREYLQRTLTQIKVAQDEIMSSYAENCISDVNSCLSTNSYSLSDSSYAINACKAQIVTCMSVNGNMEGEPKPQDMIDWVESIQQRTNTNNGDSAKYIKWNLNGVAKWKSGTEYQKEYVAGGTITLPGVSALDGVGSNEYWCYKKSATATTLTCVSVTSSTSISVADAKGLMEAGGKIYLSIANSSGPCESFGGAWSNDTGCVCTGGKVWSPTKEDCVE